LKLNLSKCEIWWPTLNVKKLNETYREKAEHLWLNDTDGTELLGSCIGSSSAKEATLLKRVCKIQESLAALKYVDDPQCALILLRSCFSLPKINFALRTLHITEVRNAIQEMDAAIDDAFKFILEANDLSKEQRDQAALPCQTGFPGFGLPKVGATSHSAFLGSVVASLKVQAELLLSASTKPNFSKEDFSKINDLAMQSLEHINHFLDADSKMLLPQLTAFKKPQHELSLRTAKVANDVLLNHYKGMATSDDKEEAERGLHNLNRLKSCCLPGSSNVFKVIPLLDRTLPGPEFRIWSKLRF
jgi:hypothetical protein